MKTRKYVAFLLALLMLLTLCACGDKAVDVAADEYIYFGYDEGEDINFPDPENPMDPAEVYSGLQLTEKMLYGLFKIAENSDEQFMAEHSFSNQSIYYEYGDIKQDLCISSVPVSIKAGVAIDSYSYPMVYDKNHEWATLSFYTEDGRIVSTICSYTVENNIVSYTPVNYYQRQYAEDFSITGVVYEVGDESIDYKVQRTADTMTLTSVDNGESVTLYTDGIFDESLNSASLRGELTEGSPAAMGLSEFSVSKSYNSSTSFAHYEFEDEAQEDVFDHASATRDGLINFWFTVDDVEYFESFVYLCTFCSSVLIDEDGNAYYYTDFDPDDGEGINVVEIDDATALKMQQTRTEILDAMVSAMEAGGIDISVNYETGEVSLDAGILFDVNSYSVSDSGKAMLDKFIEIYTSVVFGDRYKDCVSSIVVEGHTDTNGDYGSNQTLSENRANAVLNYCLGCSACAGYAEQMEDMMSALGMSYDRPVYNDDGSVNMDASRRVSFRIVVVVPEI